MDKPANILPQPANLAATAILDIGHNEVRGLAQTLIQADQDDHGFLRNAHLRISDLVRPVYSVDEWQPASKTLQKKKGSCSQRMACLEAVARAVRIPTRVRALHVKGSFWYPRFRLTRPFIPTRILLVWPQFFLQRAWLDFDELFSSIADLAATASHGFRNDGESLFEAVQKTPVDFLSKTCGLACARPEYDLSKFVLDDAGFFDARDAAFEQFGSFQHTLRGRAFELVFGGRKSS